METGWWLSLPLWKMMEFVSWDDDIPNMMGQITNVPNHQPNNVKHIWKKLGEHHISENALDYI